MAQGSSTRTQDCADVGVELVGMRPEILRGHRDEAPAHGLEAADASPVASEGRVVVVVGPAVELDGHPVLGKDDVGEEDLAVDVHLVIAPVGRILTVPEKARRTALKLLTRNAAPRIVARNGTAERLGTMMARIARDAGLDGVRAQPPRVPRLVHRLLEAPEGQHGGEVEQRAVQGREAQPSPSDDVDGLEVGLMRSDAPARPPLGRRGDVDPAGQAPAEHSVLVTGGRVADRRCVAHRQACSPEGTIGGQGSGPQDTAVLTLEPAGVDAPLHRRLAESRGPQLIQ